MSLSIVKSAIILSAFFCVLTSADYRSVITNSLKLGDHCKECESESSKCTITSTESCSLTNMKVGESVLVVPDKKTSKAQCIFGDPFQFQVIRGASDKVLFYFQGGGACWDKLSTEGGFCTTTAEPNSAAGVFDPSNAANPFKDYTIIHALYCSGDVWGGNVTQPYKARTHSVTQVGVYNALSVIDWTKKQFSSGALASTMTNFIVMGCSAGSIGTQLWSRLLLTKHFPNYKNAAVVPDSYAAVFPPGTVGKLVKGYGLCTETAGILSPNLVPLCEDESLTMQDIEEENLRNTPVSVSFIQSKIDDVQMSFYVAIGVSMNASSKAITPSEFYADVNDIFERYNKQKNFLVYLVDGPQHCFTPINVMYSATPLGPNGDGKTAKQSSEPSLAAWLSQLPLIPGKTLETECEGELSKGTLRAAGDNTYCSSGVVPKSYTD